MKAEKNWSKIVDKRSSITPPLANSFEDSVYRRIYGGLFNQIRNQIFRQISHDVRWNFLSWERSLIENE
jgi:hypothetical protein